jgi:hypothetical protein
LAQVPRGSGPASARNCSSVPAGRPGDLLDGIGDRRPGCDEQQHPGALPGGVAEGVHPADGHVQEVPGRGVVPVPAVEELDGARQHEEGLRDGAVDVRARELPAGYPASVTTRSRPCSLAR